MGRDRRLCSAECLLIDDTIRNNVAFGLRDIDDADIWKALEQAQLKAFVETLPAGLDTIVGDRGQLKFSGRTAAEGCDREGAVQQAGDIDSGRGNCGIGQ